MPKHYAPGIEGARQKARAAGKTPASDKVPKKGLTQREKDLSEISRYNSKYRAGKKSDTRPLSSLGDFGKRPSTATSGGSKSVRKIDSKQSLVDRLRKNPFKYIK